MNDLFSFAWNNAAEHITDTRIVNVTPALAAHLLTKNPSNRTIKKNLVRKLTREIQLGRWETTHQSIAIDTDGNLIDGQHRLTSILAAQTPVKIRVTINCKPETMEVVDVGKSRTISDMLKMDNYAHPKQTCAALNQVIRYERFPNRWWTSEGTVVTSKDVKIRYQELSDDGVSIDACIREAAKRSDSFQPLSPSIAASFAIIAHANQVNPGAIDGFFDELAEGINLRRNSVIRLLRNRWLSATKTMYPHAHTSQIKLAEMITVFNAHMTGKDYEKLPPVKMPNMPSFK